MLIKKNQGHLHVEFRGANLPYVHDVTVVFEGKEMASWQEKFATDSPRSSSGTPPTDSRMTKTSALSPTCEKATIFSQVFLSFVKIFTNIFSELFRWSSKKNT